MLNRVTPLPGRNDPAVALAGDEAWLSTLEDPHDTTARGLEREQRPRPRRTSTRRTHRR